MSKNKIGPKKNFHHNILVSKWGSKISNENNRLEKCKPKRISNFQNSLYCLGGDNSDSYYNSRHSALDGFPMVLSKIFLKFVFQIII